MRLVVSTWTGKEKETTLADKELKPGHAIDACFIDLVDKIRVYRAEPPNEDTILLMVRSVKLKGG
jgi:hypothetical protein